MGLTIHGCPLTEEDKDIFIDQFLWKGMHYEVMIFHGDWVDYAIMKNLTKLGNMPPISKQVAVKFLDTIDKNKLVFEFSL